jgi:hypothetical protein
MSFSASRWAWDQRCRSGIAKSVLLCLADYADHNGEAVPSIPTIADRVQHGEAAVKLALTHLIEDGKIEREARTKPGTKIMTSYRYRVPVVALPPADPPAKPDRSASAATTNSPPPLDSNSYPPPPPLDSNPSPGVDSNPGGNPTSTNQERKKEASLPKNRSLAHLHAETPSFEAFWQAYPRRVGKGHAVKAYTRALREGADPAAILDAVRHQRFPMDPQFIKHPATWLNAKCWLDEVPESANDRLLRIVGLSRPRDATDQLPLLMGPSHE